MQLILSVFHGLAVMGLITIVYGRIQRSTLPRWKRHLLMGAMFGIAAAVAMMEPIRITDGVQVDMRNLFIAFSGAFLGPIGSAAALAIGCATRLAIGGTGAPLGMLSMAMAALIGLAWTLPTVRPEPMRHYHYALMGGSVAITLTLAPFLSIDGFPYMTVVPAVACFDLFGGLIFGSLLGNERAFARRERYLHEQANRDPLTNLLNRRALETHYAALMAPQGSDCGALLLVDLDHFKSVNDTYGHAVGDELLICVADTITRTLREGDLVARIGGEEFAVLLPDTSEHGAYVIAERLRKAIRKGARPNTAPNLLVTTSVGGACFPDGFPPLADALVAADVGLYSAKDQGRDRTVMQKAAA